MNAADVDLGSLSSHLGYLLRRAQLWVFQDFIRTLAPLDIRPAQYSVLIVIDENPGLSQATLAQALGIERARLVHLLDRLEGRKLLKRIASTVDRRSHALYLTSEGESLLRRVHALASQHEKRLAEKIGVSRYGQLVKLLSVFKDG
jgi:DNA-binding MarR family transcriptional regulator